MKDEMTILKKKIERDLILPGVNKKHVEFIKGQISALKWVLEDE